jgi:hypothetical protein
LAGEEIELRELVASLKHDLGKSVAWRSANLDEAAWTGPVTDELVEALRADILRTRGDDPAWAVWRRLSAPLPRPFAEPELAEVERAIERLRTHEAALREADRVVLARARADIREAQRTIREALRGLQRRLVTGGEG